MTKRLFVAVNLVAFFTLSFSWALAASQQPAIELIVGAKVIQVDSQGRMVEAAEGSLLRNGDRIKTGPRVSVRVLYPDGAQLLVGRSSEVEILPKDNTTYWSRLSLGQARAIIPKPKVVNKKARHRFGIKTKTAVMGVRGTDFVVETDEKGESSQVHTLDGQVEVAKDEGSLLDGKGFNVLRDQFVKATPGDLLKPAKFDRQQYLDVFKQKQPDFQGIMNKLPRPQEQLEKMRGTADAAKAKAMDLQKNVVPPKTPNIPQPPTVPQPPKNPFGH